MTWRILILIFSLLFQGCDAARDTGSVMNPGVVSEADAGFQAQDLELGLPQGVVGRPVGVDDPAHRPPTREELIRVAKRLAIIMNKIEALELAWGKEGGAR